MKLYRAQKWYNPFYIDVNNKSCKLDKISVFEDGKVLASTNSGWFGSNNFVDELEIACDCVLKRVTDLSLKTAFIKKCSEEGYELFIPNEVVKLTEASYEKHNIIGWVIEKRKSTIYKEIFFETIHPFNQKIQKISGSIRFIGDKISHFGTPDTTESIDNYIRELNKYILEYDEEYDRLKNATAEELMSSTV